MSVKLKSRHNWPIGGFKFIDAAISDVPVGDTSMGFAQVCQAVQARRAANPRFNLSTDMATIEREVDEQNALRMLHIRGGENYIVKDGEAPANFPLPVQRALRSAAAGVSAVRSGAATLTDWLGDGGQPVAPELAEARAKVCAVCPQNDRGDWTRFFTVPAAEAIRKVIELRKSMKLATASDAELGTCSACKCVNNLKVWVPIGHVKKYLTPEVQAKLDEKCWVTKE